MKIRGFVYGIRLCFCADLVIYLFELVIKFKIFLKVKQSDLDAMVRHELYLHKAFVFHALI